MGDLVDICKKQVRNLSSEEYADTRQIELTFSGRP